MSALRNAAFALFAVGLLGAGLLVLVPTTVDATQVRLQTSDVSPVTISTDNTGTVNDAYSFNVRVPVRIAAGEHIPISYARVLLSQSTAGFVGGVLTPTLCDQNTAGTGTAGVAVVITSISGATRVTGTFAANGYTVAANANGYGYDFTNPAAVTFAPSSGYGYGYGYSSGVTVTVTLRVTGCVGPVGSAAPFAFTNGNPQVNFKVQVFVGGGAGQTFPSAPVTVALFDPNFVPPAAPNAAGSSSLVLVSASASGGTESVSFALTDSDGDGTAFEPVPAGAVLTSTFPASIGSTDAVSFTITATQQLPAGTQILFSFQDDGTTQALANPPFGINPTLLATQTGNVLPAHFFQVHLARPGESTTNANGLVSIDVVINVPQAYFAATGTSNFALRAFKDDGTLEAPQPQIVGAVQVGTDYRYTFRITAFSAFAGHGTVAGGAGGGGGGGAAATSTSASATSTTTTSSAAATTSQATTSLSTSLLPTSTGPTTSASTGTTSATSAPPPPQTTTTKGKGGIPGPSVAWALAAVAAAAGIALRRKLADR